MFSAMQRNYQLNKISLIPKNRYKLFIVILFSLFILITVCLILTNVEETLINQFFFHPLYLYSMLLFSISSVISSLIVRKCKGYTPSNVLFVFFLSVPIIGSLNYAIYLKSHQWPDLEFAFPTFLWAVGASVLLAGIYFSHLVIKIPKPKYILEWDSKRGFLVLWLTVGICLAFTAIALYKIGYVPLFASYIDRERMLYHEIAGEWTLKLSRLCIIVGSMCSMFAFTKPRKKLYFFIVLLSAIASFIYGQRLFLFLVITTYVLISSKFQRPKFFRLILFGICIIFFLAFYQEFRAGRSTRQYKSHEVVAANLFSEWREYSYIVNEVRESGAYYKETIFYGALVGVFPKQIWTAFGVDKRTVLRKYGAAWVMGKEFRQGEWGIRIGTIGEAYAGYGLYYGVCLQMFLFGILFGFLEMIYLRLDKRDARHCLICFLLSLLLYLPLTTLFVTIVNSVYFGFFFVLFLLLGTKKSYGIETYSREQDIKRKI